MFQELLFITILCIIFARAIMITRAGRITSCLVSLISGLIYLTCLWIPVHLQSMGLIVGKLEGAGIVSLPTAADISDLSMRWALELTIIAIAEFVGVLLCRPGRHYPILGKLGSDTREARQIAVLLIVIGLIVTIVLPPTLNEHRGEGGQGIGVVLHTFLVMGLAVLAYNKFFRRWLYIVIGMVGIALTIASGVRSPLLIVLSALLAGVFSRDELNLRRAVSFVLLLVSFGLAGAFMSGVRGAIIRGQVVSKSGLAVGILQNPLQSVYGAGMDTLDGYRFCMLAQPMEQARPESVMTIFTTFIPREVWPDKPTDPSADLSAKYFNYGASGQFLSPVGYLSIVFGGYLQALAGMFIFTLLASQLAVYLRKSLLLAIVICVVARFLLGGAFFDIYYGLVLLIPLLLCTAVIRFLQRRGVLRSTPGAEADGRPLAVS